MSEHEDGLFDVELEGQPDRSAWQDSRARAIRRSRNDFRTHPAPTDPMSRVRSDWFTRAQVDEPVAEDVRPFADWFNQQPDVRERFRWALRDSLNELLDGQRTGRWCYQHLSKTEKTYLGTAVEVNLTKEFDIPNGEDLDWRVAGADLDCKFSKDLGGWEIPMEMYLCADHGERSGKANHAALLTWMNDDTSQWAAGLLTITDERLRWRRDRTTNETVRAYNRDNKRRLAEGSVPTIDWLWGGLQTDLPTNLLLHLPAETRGHILSGSSGQGRIDKLFEVVQERLVGRDTVLTVGQQDDAPKRARDSRKRLQHKGIIVLGHQESHPIIANILGLPVPVKGEWVSARLVEVSEADSRPFITLDGRRWACARGNEREERAPDIPKKYPCVR